jgi:hypothetical protein
MRYCFVTVTDYSFFPGTFATVSSVRVFHSDGDIIVVENHKHPLSEPQRACLESVDGLKLIDSRSLAHSGRHINAWELKAYAVCDLAPDYDVVIGIDSDCLLCGSVEDVIERCLKLGCFVGGQDGRGADYDASYSVYGIPTPVRNPKYMSTSLFFVPVNDSNLRVLKRWAECCSSALFNGQGPYPGHGDQGVLNAVLFSEQLAEQVQLLDNRIWSQHWCYWDSTIECRDGRFFNRTAGGAPQRSFHCGGAEKYWVREHRDRILERGALQTAPYIWYLTLFWFGPYRNWGIDPFQYLPQASHHLVQDLVNFFPQIAQQFSQARKNWDEMTDCLIDRVLSGIPRALSLRGGSMTEVINLVASNPMIHRYVEVGGYEGGSILTLALRFLNRDVDFYCVESFQGNLDGTMDGHSLPSRDRFLANLAKYPALRAKLIPGDSALAATAFDDKTVDMVFIDACHETPAVMRDINAWISKIRPGGILAGDDYDWESVQRAVHQGIGTVEVTPSGYVWWKRL